MIKKDKLWMYCDYLTGRMLALGTEEEMKRVADMDFKMITKMKSFGNKNSTIFPGLSS